jgi:hypothetical protein
MSRSASFWVLQTLEAVLQLGAGALTAAACPAKLVL